MTPQRLVLLGHPVSHSVSPRMQNAALAAAGLDMVYESLDVPEENLDSVVARLRAENAGGNVTRPHKKSFRNLCDSVTDAAQNSGAVNTFWMEDGELCGDNTDAAGFDRAVRSLVQGPLDGRVLLLGSGGAAAGVLEALSQWPSVMVDLVARNRVSSFELRERYSGFVRQMEMMPEVAREARLVVNATPVGQEDDAFPIDVELLDPRCKVFDLVYKRGGTMLVRLARARGLRAEEGSRMLLEQGALAFERWFSRAPDRNAMQLAIA